MERLSILGAQKPVVIFSKTSCCICYTIKSLFSELAVNAAVHELDQDPRGKELEKALKKCGRNPPVPAVFIGGQLVGGSNEIMARHVNGSLVPLLKDVGATWLISKSSPMALL